MVQGWISVEQVEEKRKQDRIQSNCCVESTTRHSGRTSLHSKSTVGNLLYSSQQFKWACLEKMTRNAPWLINRFFVACWRRKCTWRSSRKCARPRLLAPIWRNLIFAENSGYTGAMVLQKRRRKADFSVCIRLDDSKEALRVRLRTDSSTGRTHFIGAW